MAKKRYAVEITQEALKSKHPFASFMVDGKAVTLDADNPRFETTDERVYRGLRDVPGLKALGEISEPKGGDG